ncbi:MAG: DUF6241 domain-containing protein [Clostridium sp.]
MHKKLTIRLILVFSTVMTLGAIVFFVATSNGWDYKHFLGIKPVMAAGQVVGTKEKTKEMTKENEKEDTKVYTELEVVNMMHDMVNTLIIAEDNKIWGTKEVNKVSVLELLNMIESTEDFNKKVIVTEIAKDWEMGNFDNVVLDHNIVWGILDGTVGKANEVNVAAVAEAKEYLK